MLTLALLWVMLVTAEGLAYARLPLKKTLLRSMVIAVLLVLLILSTALRLWAGWQAWAVFCLLSAYRAINLARFWYARLPEAQLRPVSIRAHVWLVTMQAAVLAVGSVVNHWHWGRDLVNTFAAVQFIVAILLLRATTHTWRHASVPPESNPLTDRELPALSVLVPARNETSSLERCLQMLTASDYPKLEVVVLDDCSVTRRTPEIIRSFAQSGVRFVHGKVPDETRWLAKNYACEQLVQAASGDVLLFCGVDAQLDPHSMRRLVTILEQRNKNMLSVMPLRRHLEHDGKSLLQAMRYYWELCLPRRFFKRPPVLSTCWLIRRDALKQMGGFEAVSRSVSPEAIFAREAVVTDSYSFIRSDDTLGVYSIKPAAAQHNTSVRVRYPQLHRRLELVAAVTLLECVFLLGPLVGLLFSGTLPRSMAYASVWGLACACLLVTYAFAAVGPRLASPWYGWLFMPVAFALDIALLHISMWHYEFDIVEWKGRNVCLPVMQVTRQA